MSLRSDNCIICKSDNCIINNIQALIYDFMKYFICSNKNVK